VKETRRSRFARDPNEWTHCYKLDDDQRARYRGDYPLGSDVEDTTMPDVLISDVDEATLQRLEDRARSHGRSLSAELRLILQQAATQVDMATARALAEQMTQSLGDRPHTDSAALLRDDRGR
jgi:plasmid stability protein